jgi:DNA-binding PadR family transcriptional regulator
MRYLKCGRLQSDRCGVAVAVSKGQGALRYALLGLLAGSPGTGYALKKRFASELASSWHAETSQIYPELARLVEDGLIREVSRGARGSRTYSITDAGLGELVRWLKESEPNRASRNEALMRLFFFFLLDDEESAELFRRETAYHRQALAEYEAWKVRLAKSNVYTERFNQIVLDWGIRYEQAFIEWLEWAETEAKRARKGRGFSRTTGAGARRAASG